MAEHIFFFGDWQVSPTANSLQQGRKKRQLEPKAMDVLCYLCERAGAVVSSDELIEHCWAGIDTGDNPLHKTIAQLRRALDDSATSPTYIETIRKRGYRTLAEVRFPIGSEENVVAEPEWSGESPFPGLRAYSADDAKVFFGRSEQIQLLLERIGQQVKFGRDFCLVLGPSGSGKSSLINAGIIPNLMTQQGAYGVQLLSYAALDMADVSGETLWLALASTMLDWEIDDVPVFDGESADSLAGKLEQDMAAVIAQLKQYCQPAREQSQRFGLFVDRLEVLLSSPAFSDSQRQQGVALIERLATSGAVLLLSACRNEFYPQLVSYESLRAGKGRGAHFDLTPPSRQALLQMIRLPAVAAGLSWQVDNSTATPLDEILCSDAASNPDALPMLQYMLQQLYLRRSEQGEMRLNVYHELGGLEGAIGVTAEDAIEQLSAAERQALPRVLSLLVALREDEQSITSRSAIWQQLHSPEERALVEVMVERRLFVSQLHQGLPGFHIAHEALLRRWPRARDWINKHKDMLAQKARLFHSARRWLMEARASAYLLQEGKPLHDAQQLMQNPLLALDDDEQQFVQASLKRAKHRAWLRRGTISTLVVLTLVSVLMSARSIDAEHQATARRLDAENLLGFMVGEFADKLRSIGRMDLLDGISNKALEYFTASSNTQDKTLGFDGRFQHGQTLEAIAEVAYSRGKNDEAKSALLAAEQEFVPLLQEQPHNLELLKSLGANAFWQGQLEYDKSNWQATAEHFDRYLGYSQEMYIIAPTNKDAQLELSYALNSLGSVQFNLKNFSRAKALFQQSLTQKETLLNASPNDESLIGDVADARSWLASALVAEGDSDTAIKVWESIEKDFDREEYTNNAYIQERISSAKERMADSYLYKGDIDKAYNSLASALAKVESELSQDENNLIWIKDYVRIKSNFLYLKSLSRKEFDYDEIISLLKMLALLKDDDSYQFNKLRVFVAKLIFNIDSGGLIISDVYEVEGLENKLFENGQKNEILSLKSQYVIVKAYRVMGRMDKVNDLCGSSYKNIDFLDENHMSKVNYFREVFDDICS
ncbi:winged helix-turn-helix domain-containing protein [Shewanella mangrovi]|uniref:nSTAND1 domain-containing NTPase n=1 Tax=Shewanella mangrovi TaxID=1515746 RepID=UPI00068A24AB|nr:winged helix-turn-helix domain-containing protein [Shewanella mangrovi]